jgi:murein hydrolase activator
MHLSRSTLKFLAGIPVYKAILLAGLLLFSYQSSFSQNRKDLEKKRNSLQSELKEAARLLEKTTKAQKNEYQRFQVLQTQVQKREELMQTIQREIRLVDRQIEANMKETRQLESDVEKLFKEYGLLLQKVYRINMTSDRWLLMLSSRDMNQALQRWTYINQIKKARAEQAEILFSKKKELAEKKKQLENYRREKASLLDGEAKEKQQIAQELEEKNKLLTVLKKDESKIRKSIKDKEIAREKLNAEIQKIIALEIEKQRREAKERARKQAEEEAKKRELAAKKEAERLAAEKAAKEAPKESPSPVAKEPVKESREKAVTTPEKKTTPAAPAKPAPLPATPGNKALSESFASNKGNLPWPVQKGSISQRFGTQPHPIIPSVMISNRGINIRTEKGSEVRSVFKGEVVGKRFIPGMEYTVIVQHGNYFTVYSKLDEVVVREGQKINTGEILGRAAVEEEEIYSEIHFELWQDKNNQDPALWIKK